MLVSTIKDELKDIERELATQTDRGAAIIGAAILDDFLTDALKKRLILTADVRDRLFSHEINGPLSNFSGKIDIGFAVGLYGTDARSDFHCIRRIRNRFAHTPGIIKFSDEKILAWCASLRTVVIKDRDPRRRYLSVCSGAAATLASLALADIITLKKLNSIPEVHKEIAAIFEKITEKAFKELEPFLKPES